MLLDYRKFDLFGKTIFERIRQKTPFKVHSQMPNDACFLYLEEGEYQISSPLENVRVHSQEAVLMRCGSYFTEFVRTITARQYEAIVVHLDPEVLKRIYEGERADAVAHPKHPAPLRKYANDTLLKIYVESLKIYFDNPDLVTENIVALKLRELLLLLTKSENAATVGQLIASLFSQQEYSFRKVIEAHLYEEFSIEKLALLTHRSPSSFKREFSRLYNDSPGRYFRNKKLDRATQLLLVGHKSMAEIAEECGFHDQAQFTKSFHSKFGLSPSAYRLDQKHKSLT